MVTNTPLKVRIEKAIAQAPTQDRDSLRARLERLQRSCGCLTGAAAMLFGALAVVAYVITSTSDPLPVWLLVPAALIASAAIGKVIGLSAAQVRLRWLLRTARRSPRQSAA